MDIPSKIGLHPVAREGDTLRMEIVGIFTLADSEALRDVLAAMRREHGTCFLIADATRMTGIAAEARRFMSAWSKSSPEDRITGAAVHGVNFAMRTIITLTINAIRFMGRREVMLTFAADEDESRRWISAQRALAAGPQARATG